eukprot:6981372-Pyramimonas_sp.AAC.1
MAFAAYLDGSTDKRGAQKTALTGGHVGNDARTFRQQRICPQSKRGSTFEKELNDMAVTH